MKRLAAFALLFVLLAAIFAAPADAKRKRKRAKKKAAPEQIVVSDGDGDSDTAPSAGDAAAARTRRAGREKVFDFTGLSIEGKLRTPQLLYFLGRARQELERASLEQRTFIPEMVRSVDAEGL